MVNEIKGRKPSLSWDVYAWVGVVGTRDDLPDNDDSGDDAIGEDCVWLSSASLNGSNGIAVSQSSFVGPFQDGHEATLTMKSVETMRMPTQQERERF